MTRYLCPDAVLLDGHIQAGRAVAVNGALIESILPLEAVPAEAERESMSGLLAPGFIDLQVNGGGDLLFNDQPDLAGLRRIAAAHAALGTTGFLPTVITDTPAVLESALGAVEAAVAQGMPGVLGLHVEGPFIQTARSGIHAPEHIRRLDGAMLERLIGFRGGRLLVTLAPECVAPGVIRRLVDAGVVVAAGHTAASYEQIRSAMDEGLSGFTHLYNAMSQLTSRQPGAVGAALDDGHCWASVIVDGYHVHPAALRIARSCLGHERMVLVSDAMPPVGGRESSFRLQGRKIMVEDGRCVSAEGTLAGAAIALADAVRRARDEMNMSLEAAIGLATRAPARALGIDRGAIKAGHPADLVLLDEAGAVQAAWVGGQPAEPPTWSTT